MKIKRQIMIYAVGFLLVIFSSSVSAQAQTASCSRLQAKLDVIHSSNTQRKKTRVRYQQYVRAVKDQRYQIMKTRNLAWRNRCQSNFSNEKKSDCKAILASLDEMNAHLIDLDRERQLLLRQQGRSGGNSRRLAIIRQMNQYQCFKNGAKREVANNKTGNKALSLLEKIFNTRVFSDLHGKKIENEDTSPPSNSVSANAYRTMCVRKQDGYYFPVSFAITPKYFKRDEKICQSRCPGNDVALYYYAVPTQNSEDMISFRKRQPYTDLPSAFAYREKFNPEITCNLAPDSLQSTAENDNKGTTKTGKKIAKSNLSLIAGPPLELIQNDGPQKSAKQKDQVADITPPPNKSKDTSQLRDYVPGERKVRIVGPAFYPVQ